MEELAEDVREFLAQHPELQPVPGNKVRFTVTGHELPCRLLELQNFIAGKKYKHLMEISFDGSKYEPHIIPSTKNPGQMFCKLTLRHIAKRLEDVQRHVNGKRYQRAFSKYEECQKLGVEYVPACIRNKPKQRKFGDERQTGKKGQQWEPDDSSGEDSDSGDSMSDLYPEHMFTKKTTDNGQNGDFQSDSDEEMEVEESVNSHKKRPQKQAGPSRKKLKSHHKKSKKKSSKK